LTIKVLTAGPQKLLVDKSAKKICQFLAIKWTGSEDIYIADIYLKTWWTNRFAITASRCKGATVVIASNLQGCKCFGNFRNHIIPLIHLRKWKVIWTIFILYPVFTNLMVIYVKIKTFYRIGNDKKGLEVHIHFHARWGVILISHLYFEMQCIKILKASNTLCIIYCKMNNLCAVWIEKDLKFYMHIPQNCIILQVKKSIDVPRASYTLFEILLFYQ
jgi:hypothetical protein